MKWAVLLAVIAVAGCGSKSDTTSQEISPFAGRPWEHLRPGDDAMIYSTASEVDFENESGDLEDLLPIGTRVRFIERTEGKARIKVLEGNLEGRIGLVLIADVRPLPKHRQ